MQYNFDQFTYDSILSIFVSIIETDATRRRVAFAFSHRDALDDLIAYLNDMMDKEVLPHGASEKDVYVAIEENLYASVEIIKVIKPMQDAILMPLNHTARNTIIAALVDYRARGLGDPNYRSELIHDIATGNMVGLEECVSDCADSILELIQRLWPDTPSHISY